MGGRSSILIIILVFGILFSLLYFSALPTTIPRVVTVVIPEGSSSESSEHNNFEPSVITVVIGVNNTVRWINEDTVPSTVLASSDGDPDFLRATEEKRNSDNPFLMPNGDTFEYTFTKEGRFDYHSEPHPWKQGAVIVLPQQ
jgi:plastocyanin